MSVSRTILLLALICVFLPSVGCFVANASDKSNCCGGKDAWRWERWVGDELKDAGGWAIGKDGVAHTHYYSVTGKIGHIIAVKFPRPSTEPFPDPQPGIHYFKGMNQDVGILIAEQLEPGEHWVFQIGSVAITDMTGFDGGSQNVEISSSLKGRWNHKWGFQSMNGFWLFQVCDNQLNWLYGSAGCQDVDIEGQDFLSKKLLALSVPPEVGCCYVMAHAAGEVFTVTIDGKPYETTATADDVDPSVKPLADNEPEIAPWLVPKRDENAR